MKEEMIPFSMNDRELTMHEKNCERKNVYLNLLVPTSRTNGMVPEEGEQ